MLTELLKEEKVEGYVCEGCKASDKCLRELKLKTLPPFLSFQLLRFVYDRTTGIISFEDSHRRSRRFFPTFFRSKKKAFR